MYWAELSYELGQVVLVLDFIGPSSLVRLVFGPSCPAPVVGCGVICSTRRRIRVVSAQGRFGGSGTPRPKTISARDSSARTFRPIFQSGTARPTLVGLLGPCFYFLFIFFGSGLGAIYCFILFMCIKTRFKKLYLT